MRLLLLITSDACNRTAPATQPVGALCRCHFLVNAFVIRVRKYGKNEVYRDGPCMFLVSTQAAAASVPLAGWCGACGKAGAHGGAKHVCMYVCACLQSNHRSWADFFIDAYITEGRGQLMSR